MFQEFPKYLQSSRYVQSKKGRKMCCTAFQPWEHAISFGPDIILIENHFKKNVSFRSLRGPLPARLNGRFCLS